MLREDENNNYNKKLILKKQKQSNFIFRIISNLNLIRNSLSFLKRNKSNHIINNISISKKLSSGLLINEIGSTHSSPLIPRKQQNLILEEDNASNTCENVIDYSFLKNNFHPDLISKKNIQHCYSTDNNALSNLTYNLPNYQTKSSSFQDQPSVRTQIICDSKGGPAGFYPSGDKIFRRKILENKQFRELFFYYVKQPNAIAFEMSSLNDESNFDNNSLLDSTSESYHDKLSLINITSNKKQNSTNVNNNKKKSIISLNKDETKSLLSEKNHKYKSKSCYNLPQNNKKKFFYKSPTVHSMPFFFETVNISSQKKVKKHNSLYANDEFITINNKHIIETDNTSSLFLSNQHKSDNHLMKNCINKYNFLTQSKSLPFLFNYKNYEDIKLQHSSSINLNIYNYNLQKKNNNKLKKINVCFLYIINIKFQ